MIPDASELAVILAVQLAVPLAVTPVASWTPAHCAGVAARALEVGALNEAGRSAATITRYLGVPVPPVAGPDSRVFCAALVRAKDRTGVVV